MGPTDNPHVNSPSRPVSDAAATVVRQGAPVWLNELRSELARREEESQLRELRLVEADGPIIRWQGRELVNFASNDYLGLSTHPRLKAAAIAATQQFGTGSGASRLVTGHQPPHADVEARFAAFKHAEAALLCPTGYMANHAAITSLVGPGDLVLADKLNHASLIDAAEASGATVRVYPHLALEKLERLLSRHAAGEKRPRRCMIITDSVFSMDGDVADLPALCGLAERYDAILMVDEAHGTGVLGEHGAGVCELQGVSDRVDVVVSTASKALGGLGGIVTARKEVIRTIVNQGRSFIYTTAVPAGQAAAIDAALSIIAEEPWRRERVLSLSRRLRGELSALGWISREAAQPSVVTPIVPLIVGDSARALALAKHLADHGYWAPAIRPPTVPRGAARVRLSLRADLSDEQVENLLRVLSTTPSPKAP